MCVLVLGGCSTSEQGDVAATTSVSSTTPVAPVSSSGPAYVPSTLPATVSTNTVPTTGSPDRSSTSSTPGSTSLPTPGSGAVTLPTVPVSVASFDSSAHEACALLGRDDLQNAIGSTPAALDPGYNAASYYSDACAWKFAGGLTLTVELYRSGGELDAQAYYNGVKSTTKAEPIPGADAFLDANFPVAYVLVDSKTMVGLILSDNGGGHRDALKTLATKLRIAGPRNS